MLKRQKIDFKKYSQSFYCNSFFRTMEQARVIFYSKKIEKVKPSNWSHDMLKKSSFVPQWQSIE